MVTNNYKVVCAKCKAVNCYEIVKLSLVDIDLHATYSCDACHSKYTDRYALVYLGGNCNTAEYDRDNIISR
jgi:transposase-like protein